VFGVTGHHVAEQDFGRQLAAQQRDRGIQQKLQGRVGQRAQDAVELT
jgi:hypothetical protein